MGGFKDYFACDGCGNKEFKRIYCFGFRFQNVNFSDSLIYDRLNEEKYQCTECHKTFTRADIERALVDLRTRHKHNTKE